ncbi:MAG: hypothetical protein LBQ75_08010, partial [Zoogloeaceae bacterium]|nr:hypothetical protein [Zoogloeaceae bacterium]
MPTHTTRRRFLASFLSLAAAPAEGFSLFGKQRARDLGKIYEYLQDVSLRIKETGSQRITIKNVIFSYEEFNDEWENFDFVDCDFNVGYNIGLNWLVKCTFTNCRFSGHLGFGDAKDVKFVKCTVNGKSTMAFAYKTTNLVFESCTFRNVNYDPNHEGGIVSKGEILFLDCKAEGAFVLESYKKLTLHHCTTSSTRLATAPAGLFSDKSKMPYSDFLLEDCDFTSGIRMSNAKLNSFIMRNCKLGVFKPLFPVIRDFALFEGIKKGHLNISSYDLLGKLTVRDCSFFTPGDDGYSFRCSGAFAAHTLIENV